MQKKTIFRRGAQSLMSVLLMTTLALSTRAAGPINYGIQMSATVSTAPAQIKVSWVSDPDASSYTLYRKAANSSSWSQVAAVGRTETSWTDSNVSVGTAYEYQLVMPASGFTGTGYIYAGVNASMIESRGKVLLVVDNTYAAQLASELTRLQQDLAGDGWTVVRRDVGRGDSVASVKNVIKGEYNNGGLRSVLLFGHVPVPYSGNFNPDGHPDHVGAYATDTYYADMDGNWTDSSVNNTSSSKPWNHNVSNDGKFDQSEIPSDLELEVGRVDLSNMTCFSNKNPSRSELDLLKQYLNKDHNFRHGMLNVQRRALICDNWGIPYGEAFAACGWRIGTGTFGAGNVDAVSNFIPAVTGNNSYLFAWMGGGGDYYSCNGVGTSDVFAQNDSKAVFTLSLGSYFLDWDNESNFLRAPLGGTSYTLTSGWAGRPQWWLHHMALGETIGYGLKLTQNNRQGGTYSPQYIGTRGVHINLHGDPTLRMHPVIPPSNLQGVAAAGSVSLTWAPSSDSAIQGYHVYRGSSANGPFTRLTSSPLAAPSFVDSSAPAGAVYMVRALKFETSASGTYNNLSQGVFYNAGGGGGGGGTPTAPIAPSNLVATTAGSSQIRLSWSDNSADETGFKIERKVGAAGTFAAVTTTAANVRTFDDGGLTQGTTYFYRVSAVNAAGGSGAIEASASTAPGIPVTTTATFVKTDTTTQGSWKGAYGADGASVMGDTAALPGYVQVTPAGNQAWTWEYAPTGTRLLQRIAASERIGAAWYADAFTVDFNFTDGQIHRTAMYFLDWDSSGRSQKVEILDANSGTVLDSQTVSGFANGKYLVWDLRGNVRVRFTKLSGANAVLNGLFFSPATAGASSMQKTTTLVSMAPNATVRISGSAGQVFKVYSTSNLTQWVENATVTLTGPTYDYTDTAGAAGRFYKAVPQ